MFYTKPWADALIVLLVVLLFFGPKRLPALGRSLGQGMREFKDSITGHSNGAEEEERPALERTATGEASPEVPAATTTPAAGGGRAEATPAEPRP